jgi:hypothetical protein
MCPRAPDPASPSRRSLAHSHSPVANSCSPVAPRTSSAVCAASLATVDLRAELELRHSGVDDRITIECQRERWRNLNGDFSAADTTPVRQATLTSTSSAGSGGGCMALTPYLCMVIWLLMFRPHLSEKYDESVNPAEFLQIYSTSILTVGGNEVVKANYFPVAPTGTTLSWLMNLPKGSLSSWAELCHQFTANFESTYAHRGNEVDLHVV